MISPTTRLIVFTALLLAPGALLYAAAPQVLTPILLIWLSGSIVAAVDAALAGRGLASLRGAFPEIVRMTKEREGTIPIHLSNLSGNALTLELGLDIPEDFRCLQEIYRLRLPGGSGSVRFDWPCTPLQRGRYRLQNIYVRKRSPLSLWQQRRILTASAELRVYPNLQQERTRLAAIFLNRGGVGAHAQRRVGKGRDFEQLREYIPGDPSEDIHWKATARRGHPVTKVYQLERTQEVYVLLDTSRLSGRLETSEGSLLTQLERSITAAMTLGLVAQKQGDLFGFVAFSDRIERFLRAGSGLAHYNAVREAVYALQTREVNPDFDELFTFLRLRLRRRALLIILTNLDDPLLAETFRRHLPLIARRHLVLVNMAPPAYIRPLFTAPDVETVEDVYDRLGGHMQWRDLRELQKSLHHQGVAMQFLTHASMAPELVTQYVNVKQRQLL